MADREVRGGGTITHHRHELRQLHGAVDRQSVGAVEGHGRDGRGRGGRSPGHLTSSTRPRRDYDTGLRSSVLPCEQSGLRAIAAAGHRHRSPSRERHQAAQGQPAMTSRNRSTARSKVRSRRKPVPAAAQKAVRMKKAVRATKPMPATKAPPAPKARADAALTVFDATRYLRTDKAVVQFVDAALETGEPAVLVRALGEVTRAKGVAEVARRCGIGREKLARELRPASRPRLETIMRIARAVGIRLHASAA
ncbi:MAG: putative addiction module antidote protein [Phycisphaerales bacterium]|nr:putative addiction module antidote protein [Phycisphaerales bacterium]